MSEEVLIRADKVGKKFCKDLKRSLLYGVQDTFCDLTGVDLSRSGLRKDEFWANSDISFEVRRGETLGLIGKNGAGKTTLLKMLNGLIKPDTGAIEMHGRVGAMIALNSGFNPLLTGRENIFITGSVLGMHRDEIKERVQEIVDFAEISEFIDSPVQNYSSGMRVRLGFSVATVLRPDIILLDEVLAVGDAKFRSKCYQRINDISQNSAIVFVSHSMEHIGRICDRCILMERGKATLYDQVSDAIKRYNEVNADVGGHDSFRTINKPIREFACSLASTEIKAYEDLQITMDVDSAEAIPEFDMRVIIYNVSGSIAADATRSNGLYGVAVAEGEQTWKINIPFLSLKSGRYSIGLAIQSPRGELIAWSYRELGFEIEKNDNAALADYQLQLQDWDIL